MRYLTEQELYHHGILGQKWGVRRFQNQDGSYTAAGRERYGIEDGKRRSLKSYALEYKDRRENKNRYTRMKKNQNLDTMSFDEMKRLQEREALKGQIQWQQKQNDPNAWKQQLKREILSTAAKGFVEGASKELGKQVISAPIKLAGYAGDKTISAAGWSARELVGVATDYRKQAALKSAFKTFGKNAEEQTTSFFNGAAGAAKGFGKEMGSQARSFGSGASQAGKAAGANTKAFYKGMTDSQNAPGWYTGARRAAYDNGQAVRRGTQGVRNNVNDFAKGFDKGFKNSVRNQYNAVNNLDRSFSRAVRRTASTARTRAGNAADQIMNYNLRNATWNYDNAALRNPKLPKLNTTDKYWKLKYGKNGWSNANWSRG